MELDGALREPPDHCCHMGCAFFQESLSESLSERESRGQVENGDNKTQLCEDPCCGIRSEFSH